MIIVEISGEFARSILNATNMESNLSMRFDNRRSVSGVSKVWPAKKFNPARVEYAIVNERYWRGKVVTRIA